MPYKVAVLMGGASVEREFSFASGKAICEALERCGHQVVTVEPDEDLVKTLRAECPDVAINALQGKDGEDGSIQALMELLSIPLVGSPADVCRHTWDKASAASALRRYLAGEIGAAAPVSGVIVSRQVYESFGIKDAFDLIEEKTVAGYPLVVKPLHQGLALGMSKVNAEDELAPAIEEALEFDDEVLVQEWVEGVQLSVAVLGEGPDALALPPVEIAAESGVYDTQARLDEETVEFYAPVRLESLSADEFDAQAIRSEIERAAIEVHRAYGARDLSRVDVIWDGARARVIEIDVVPGFAAGSAFPKSCEAAGLSVDAVLNELLDQAVFRG